MEKFQVLAIILKKKCPVLGNFLTFKWQFSGGSCVYTETTDHNQRCRSGFKVAETGTLLDHNISVHFGSPKQSTLFSIVLHSYIITILHKSNLAKP